jgi:hypothetical protein
LPAPVGCFYLDPGSPALAWSDVLLQQTKAHIPDQLRVNPYNDLSLTLQGHIMSTLIELIKALIPSIKSQKDLDEAYLCQSANVYDLERRMKDIDHNARNQARSLISGTMMP